MTSSSGILPQESEAQRIGHMAGRCLNATHPESWRLKALDGTDAFGLDYQVQTVVDGQVRDIFRLQLKGTTAPETSADGSFISIDLKASTVRYYDGITEAILLVLLLEQNDKRVLRCHMTLETLAEVGDNPSIILSAVTV